jgi:hypothetical protein
MKNNWIKTLVFAMAFAMLIGLMAACDKSSVNPDTDIDADISYSAARQGATTDTACKGKKITEIAVADIPAAAKTYIATNFVGAMMKFAGKDTDGNFVVGITLADGTNKGLKFTSAGVFVTELKQHKAKANITKIAVADLPAAIKTYIATKYVGATTDKAGKNDLGEIFVKITVGTTKTVLVFDAKGVFVKVMEKPAQGPGNDNGHGKGPR